jgi:hypothetical protein
LVLDATLGRDYSDFGLESYVFQRKGATTSMVYRRKKLLFQGGAFLALAVWLGVFQACMSAPPPAPLPQSPWGDKYAYSYDLPSTAVVKPAGSVPVTVAVVNPFYKEQESALATELYGKVGKGLSASMGTDLDKILIAKGVTTTGPFPSLDEITYSEKKDASLTLAPRVFITSEIKYTTDAYQVQGAARLERHFTMNVTGWVTFIMQEPLSGQKMWIKKLELDALQKEGVVDWEGIPQYTSDGCGGTAVTGYLPGNIVYDGRVDALASALKEMYPVVMSQFQRYIDTDEMVALKEKVQEIRSQKVF